jgi:CheY-like chemotaxis protein
MSYDFAEVWTQSVREVLPLALAKGLRCAFDHRGPQLMPVGDASAMRRGLHRLLCATIDLLEQGQLVLLATPRCVRGGTCQLTVSLAGTGRVADNRTIGAVLERLGLHERGTDVRLRRASGPCPATGAAVEFASLPGQGLVFGIELTVRQDGEQAADEPLEARARAWVVDADDVAAEALTSRLQRLGWSTMRFVSPGHALRRLRAFEARPALLVLADSPTVGPDDAQRLAALMPSWTQCVYAAVAGAHCLAVDDAVPGFDMTVQPLSPGELRQLTVRVDASAEPSTGPAALAIPPGSDRPRLLVVDDSAVNRVVACALAQSLGYEVETAADGHEALRLCERTPPAVVLMDVDMDRMDGLTATRLLRERQRRGAIPPFHIVAATSDANDDTRRRCVEAGMEGFLTKPLRLQPLRAELRRVGAGAGAVSS